MCGGGLYVALMKPWGIYLCMYIHDMVLLPSLFFPRFSFISGEARRNRDGFLGEEEGEGEIT